MLRGANPPAAALPSASPPVVAATVDAATSAARGAAGHQHTWHPWRRHLRGL